MKALPLTLNCPRCGSADVVYSCEPECCFNHVCGDCLASFQLKTRDVGGKLADFSFQASERDCLAPTVPCARCNSLNVAEIDEDDENVVGAKLACVDCKALLEIDFDSED